MAHEPAPVRLTVAPTTAHGPTALNVTPRPEEAVALSANEGSPNVLFGNNAKVIVCDARAMEKVRVTGGAGSTLASPAWNAVTVQLPAPVRVTVTPDTAQLPAVRKLTSSPDDAVALSVNGGSPYVRFTRASKEMVW